jgi:hypothetical protein
MKTNDSFHTWKIIHLYARGCCRGLESEGIIETSRPEVGSVPEASLTSCDWMRGLWSCQSRHALSFCQLLKVWQHFQIHRKEIMNGAGGANWYFSAFNILSFISSNLALALATQSLFSAQFSRCSPSCDVWCLQLRTDGCGQYWHAQLAGLLRPLSVWEGFWKDASCIYSHMTKTQQYPPSRCRQLAAYFVNDRAALSMVRIAQGGLHHVFASICHSFILGCVRKLEHINMLGKCPQTSETSIIFQNHRGNLDIFSCQPCCPCVGLK